MQLCFFEDTISENLQPLTLTRPVDDLRIGIHTISKKWALALDAAAPARLLRSHLQTVFSRGTINASEQCLWLNSRYLPSNSLIQKVNELSVGQCLQHGQTVIAACVDGATSAEWHKKNTTDFSNLFILETSDFLSINYLWDLFQLNGQQIRFDTSLVPLEEDIEITISEDAVLHNPDKIFIEEGATIEPGCILIAEKGPIYIGRNATVMAGSHIRGPVAICEEATVKMGSRIYEDTTVGPVCKVGGEIKNSIFHSYSNKGHEGFMGNSLIGQWCNIGADTNTSNLKNNYSTIRMTNWNSREQVETGQQFIGTIMADHCKTAINTQLNTGTVCGLSCNIFSANFPPKLIPSFSWVGSNVIQTYKLDKAFEAMEAMMVRRDVPLTDEYRQMMTHIFENRIS
ncbi:putative sugar nucleotidyl transferase [Fodinibius halophilus]|uniref:Glucose-1-phosphate thymidylyltransferase n=1 Tax=Fodinibius halophilus TaxID=1736908 RepID=A0A6M1TGY0_9BACT|nr:putative sugar nucleotidyl transferase [Fodinibius halophilus]NGP89362.1 glucose-1-phosphate thymidylyltransferase [Fodinibius halophilus]